MNNTLCPYPFVNIHIRPDGNIQPCCTWHGQSFGNINTDQIEDVWNNDSFKELRSKMINDEWHDGCFRCKIKEDNNLASMRQTALRVHTNYDINETLSVKFDEWDIRNTNLCNLKCQTCGPGGSSLHNGSEIKVTSNQIYEIVDNNIKTVKKVYFAGGEPLINDFHYYIIDKLIENGRPDCILMYSTNLTKLDYKKQNIIDKWKFFNNVKVFGSIDSLGPKNELLRTNSTWSTLEANLNRLIDEKVDVEISTCVSKLNVADIPKIYFYLKEKGIRGNFNNVLTSPPIFSFNAMTSRERSNAITNLAKYTNNKDSNIANICKKFIKMLTIA